MDMISRMNWSPIRMFRYAIVMAASLPLRFLWSLDVDFCTLSAWLSPHTLKPAELSDITMLTVDFAYAKMLGTVILGFVMKLLPYIWRVWGLHMCSSSSKYMPREIPSVNRAMPTAILRTRTLLILQKGKWMAIHLTVPSIAVSENDQQNIVPFIIEYQTCQVCTFLGTDSSNGSWKKMKKYKCTGIQEDNDHDTLKFAPWSKVKKLGQSHWHPVISLLSWSKWTFLGQIS